MKTHWIGGLVVSLGLAANLAFAQSDAETLNRRIDKIRKAPLTLKVVDEAGEAIEGAVLSVTMREHSSARQSTRRSSPRPSARLAGEVLRGLVGEEDAAELAAELAYGLAKDAYKLTSSTSA